MPFGAELAQDRFSSFQTHLTQNPNAAEATGLGWPPPAGHWDKEDNS